MPKQTPEQFEAELQEDFESSFRGLEEEMCSGISMTPERKQAVVRFIKTLRAAQKLGNIMLRAYQHATHGGPSRKEVEAVLKEAGLL